MPRRARESIYWSGGRSLLIAGEFDFGGHGQVWGGYHQTFGGIRVKNIIRIGFSCRERERSQRSHAEPRREGSTLLVRRRRGAWINLLIICANDFDVSEVPFAVCIQVAAEVTFAIL